MDDHPKLWIRENDVWLRDLFGKLQNSPESVTTKDFLKPVFKWLKYGSKQFAPELAFKFADWMVHIRYC